MELTAMTDEEDNNSIPLPRQYSIHLNSNWWLVYYSANFSHLLMLIYSCIRALFRSGCGLVAENSFLQFFLIREGFKLLICIILVTRQFLRQKKSLFFCLFCLFTHLFIYLFFAGHALGFFHEQSRPDRDQFVEVRLENVETGMCNQVNIVDILFYRVMSSQMGLTVSSLITKQQAKAASTLQMLNLHLIKLFISSNCLFGINQS